MRSSSDLVRRVARTVWRKLPRAMQGVAFKVFLRAVRKRKFVREVDGLRYAFDLSEGIDVQVYLGSFERDVVRAIDALCEPGWCVVDVGANVGAHTLRMSRRVAQEGKVVAFEPTTFAYEKLIRNLSLNDADNVTAIKAAASDRNSDREEIRARSSWSTYRPAEVDVSAVPFWRIDDWLEKNGIEAVDLIKVDVDGEECAVLRGAERAIRKSSPVVLLEVGAWHFERLESNPIAFLMGLGYRFWDLVGLEEYPDEQSIRRRLPEHDPEKALSLNVLAARDEAAIHTLARYSEAGVKARRVS
jgi:FkbM family methyltransferase